MIIIVDGGSTKADWELIHEDGTQELIVTIGFNPFFFSSDEITAELKKSFVKKLDTAAVKQVFFYGAGCSDTYRCEIVKTGLIPIFPNAVIEVDHDLLAAARATCGNEEGISCIIGTGSNSCAYDGEKITDNVTNLGYLLGDEGSGSHLGKMLIKAYFYRELPSELIAAFEERYPEGKRAILNKIYGESPNVYLASFATFVSDHKSNPFIQQLVREAFTEFIKRHVCKYDQYQRLPVHFVGSVAFHFQDILLTVLDEMKLTPGIIIKKPIQNLVSYHQSPKHKINSHI